MNLENSYIPILKGKRGEMKALRLLDSEIANLITPFIDVPRITLKFSDEAPTGEPKETLDVHLLRISKALSQSWPQDRVVFLDTTDLPLAQRTTKGLHPLLFLCQNSILLGSSPIPVTGFDRDIDYLNAVKEVLVLSNGDIGLRLLRQDLEDVDALDEQIEQLATDLDLRKDQIHLIFDLRFVGPEELDDCANLVENAANTISNLDDFGSFTVAGSSFPETVGGLTNGKVASLPRREIQLWHELLTDERELPRKPAFGDYGVVHPDLKELDPRIMTAGGKIRYALEDEWLVAKGSSLKLGKKYAQYFDLAKMLSGHARFLGSDFSQGDQYLLNCSKQKVSHGNLETWVWVDTNHHLTFVSQQVASVFSTSNKK